MLDLQPNQPPFLFVNTGLHVDSLNSAKCDFSLTEAEWYFKAHWPGDPNMPAVIQLETMTQVAGMILFVSLENKPKNLYLRQIKNSKFYKKIVPGIIITAEAVVQSYKRGILDVKAKIYNKNTLDLYSKAEFTLVNPDIVIART
tara:strand:+ start:222 stop:653 length:432 start_codon:yes stop_codon:yes gene_type:complete